MIKKDFLKSFNLGALLLTDSTKLLVSLSLAICAFAGPLAAQERNLYWGDTHVHTNNSLDARGLGVTLGHGVIEHIA